jgi:glycosyltransferase 2 family protein
MRCAAVKQLIKAAIAIGLIALLVWRMDWHVILPTVTLIPLWGIAVALVAMIWELIVSTLRWEVALRMHQLHFGLTYLFRALANGFFFNNFLPSAIGGDAYRVYRTLPEEGYRSRSLSAVVIDRVSGFGALLALGALGALYLRDYQIARAYLWLLTFGGLAGLITIYAAHRGWLKALTARIRHTSAFDALEHNWRHLLDARAAWVPLIFWSVVFQATSILLVYWLFFITGQPQPLAHCALMTAASGVAALLPLSINGIGLMEGSLVATAVALGVQYEEAVIVAIIRRLLMFVLSLLCGLNYLFEGQTARLPASQPLRRA